MTRPARPRPTCRRGAGGTRPAGPEDASPGAQGLVPPASATLQAGRVPEGRVTAASELGLFFVGLVAGACAVLIMPELPWAVPPWPRLGLGLGALALWVATWAGSGVLRD